jgi:PAS domain S-box-containing protein
MLDDQDFLFRCNPDPMWIYDRETLAFKAVNEAATRRYGFSEAEFLAMTIEAIHPPEDHARLLKAAAASSEAPDISGRWRHRASNGEIMTVEKRSFGIAYMGRPAKIVTVRDITELARLEIAEKQARQAQKAALDLLAVAGRVARFGGWRLELPSREVTWSDETAAIHGEPPGFQVTLERGLAYYFPDHRETATAMVERCLGDGEPFDEVMQILTADRRRLWVRTTGIAERDTSGRIIGLRGACQDIDELVRTRLKSEALESRLTDTLNASGEGFMVLDEHWRFVFVNQAAGRMLGRSPTSLEGHDLWVEFPQALGGPIEVNYREAVASRRSVAFEEFYPDLGWFDIRAYPSAGGLAVHFQNITERKQIQADLEASEERFRLVGSVTNDVIWDVDLAAGRMWWSQPATHVSGHQAEAVAWHPDFWLRNVHPDDRLRVRETVEAAVRDGADGWSSAYRIIKSDGAVAHVMDRAAIVRDPGGCARRMLGSMTDVSERLEMETRLLESQKTEALGRLTGGIAHDFNNLLTVIIGNSESLMESAVDAEIRDLAQLNVSAAAKGADLISRLLAFARRQPLTPRALDVKGLLVGLEPLLRRTINADILLAMELESDLPPVLADASQLESALLNLVVNARDAMPKGGQVTLRARAADARASEGRDASGADTTTKSWLEISVADTGEGMTPEVQRRAFDPFFTTKAVGKGTGLGLSTVYGFAAQSEGSVHIASRPGAGTTIRLLLPCARQASAPLSQTQPETEPTARTGERILVVEDDPLVRDHVARQLRAVGYCIVLAADGPEALARLQDEPRFDLMFTDVVMPGGMDGRELARQARAVAPDLRVLFTSGFIGTLDAETKISSAQWLCKPYRRQELITRVRETLRNPQ